MAEKTKKPVEIAGDGPSTERGDTQLLGKAGVSLIRQKRTNSQTRLSNLGLQAGAAAALFHSRGLRHCL